MQSPYSVNFFLTWLVGFAQPLPDFISWAVWFSVLRLVESYVGPARQYDLLACGLALSLGFGAVRWTSVAVEATCLVIASWLPMPLFGLISGATVSRLAFATCRDGVVNYFLFRETDERNLGVTLQKTAPLVAFAVVTAVAALYRFVRFWWDWIVVFTALAIVVTSVPSLRRIVPTTWARAAAWSVLKWTIRICFYTTDRVTALAHESMRYLEAWESSISKKRIATLRPYEYTPLNPSTREIRILRLRRRTARPDIVCDFIHAPVDETPPFDVVSYTWGGEPMSENIVVDGRCIAVSPTVYAWLRYRRSFFSEAYLWIDAVCINQADIDEKASQIPLMGSIYTKADRTVVWLARPGDVSDSYAARSLLMTLAMLCDQGAPNEQLQYVVSRDSSMGALLKLLSPPYFHRIWIIQEIALAKQVHVFYGTVTMNWEALARAASAMFNSRLIGSMSRKDVFSSSHSVEMVNLWGTHISNISTISQIRRDLQGGQDMSLLYILAATDTFAASIPHDNVFGLLGMITGLPEDVARPDYNEPAAKLFTRVCKHAIETTSNIALLQLAGSGFPATKRSVGIPSWVPDFSRPFNRQRKVFDRVSSLKVKSASGGNSEWNVLTVDISSFDAVATLQGQSCSMFDRIKPVWEAHAEEPTHRTPRSPEEQSRSMRDDIESFLDWHDDAVALARLNPHTVEQQPGDLNFDVLTTMCCNSPELLENSANGITGVSRYLMVMAVTRVMAHVYREHPEAPAGSLDARVRELCQTTKEEWDSVVSPEMNHFFFYIGATASNKSFCLTESGRMAMVPPASRAGDLVVYVRGQAIPFILRPVGQEGFYELIGGCYVHGVPDAGGQSEQQWTDANII